MDLKGAEQGFALGGQRPSNMMRRSVLCIMPQPLISMSGAYVGVLGFAADLVSSPLA